MKHIVGSIGLATLLCVSVSVAPTIGEDNEDESFVEVVAPVTTSTVPNENMQDISALAETKIAVPWILMENLSTTTTVTVPETTTTTVTTPPQTTTTVATAPPVTQAPVQSNSLEGMVEQVFGSEADRDWETLQ